jgi:hypothetical protein
LLSAAALLVRPHSQQVFHYSHKGDVQIFTVPDGVTKLTVEVAGAQGQAVNHGQYIYAAGGEGGLVKAVLAVASGDTLEVRVGGRSDGGAGGNGTGLCPPKHLGPCFSSTNGAPGGGASTIFVGSTLAIVAGGGGGGGGTATGHPGGAGGAGGRDGLNGQLGKNTGGHGGGGATPGRAGAGGAGGTTCGNATFCFHGVNGFGGEALAGGSGGNASPDGGGGGGGGGDGYFGGGGGGGGPNRYYPNTNIYELGAGGGGGGGSSFAESAATNVTYAQGHQRGDGTIVVTW